MQCFKQRSDSFIYALKGSERCSEMPVGAGVERGRLGSIQVRDGSLDWGESCRLMRVVETCMCLGDTACRSYMAFLPLLTLG